MIVCPDFTSLINCWRFDTFAYEHAFVNIMNDPSKVIDAIAPSTIKILQIISTPSRHINLQKGENSVTRITDPQVSGGLWYNHDEDYGTNPKS